MSLPSSARHDRKALIHNELYHDGMECRTQLTLCPSIVTYNTTTLLHVWDRMAPQINGETPSSVFLDVSYPPKSWCDLMPWYWRLWNLASHILSSHPRLHLYLQVQPIWSKIHRFDRNLLREVRQTIHSIPPKTLPICLSIRRESRRAWRLYSIHHWIEISCRQETYRRTL